MSFIICTFVLLVVDTETGSGGITFAEGRLLDVVFGEDNSDLPYIIYK